MRSHLFDPYLAHRRCLWRNRLARWRQAPGEAAFHAMIWLALAVLSGMAVAALAARRELARDILALTQAAPWAWLLAWGGLIAMRVRLRLRDWERRDAAGWLGAQPVAPRVRQCERGRVVLGCIVADALAGALLFAFLRLPWTAWGWLILMLVAASAAGVVWAQWRRPGTERATGADVGNAALSLRCFVGRGGLWRWQMREVLSGIGPRPLRHGLWMLLLIPAGTGASAAALALAAGLALAAYLSAWRRGLGVLVQAERWLGAQPARARFWLSGLRVPLALAVPGAATTGLALAALGAGHVAPWVALVLLALAMLQASCTLALRRTPARIPLAFTVHLALIGAAWQAFPPVLAPLWLAMCLRLVHRGIRP